jgi:glucosylceramidase
LATFQSSFNPVQGEFASSPSRSQLLSTAFLNPDGKMAIVVMNASEKNVAYWLWLNGNAAKLNGLPHSIQTLVV